MKDYTLYRVVIQLIQGETSFTLQNVEQLENSEIIDIYQTKNELLTFLGKNDFNYPFNKYKKSLSKNLYKQYMNTWSNLLDITAEKVQHIQEMKSTLHENHYTSEKNLHITLYMVVRG